MARTPTIRSGAEKVAVNTGLCSGCGGKYPRKELIYLHEDNHDNLTYFHGDKLCRSCANSAGVSF